MIELSISQVKKHPANFMYVWADEERFLRYIKPKYASIIRTKKANQRKLILLSAQKYINKNAVMDGAEFKQYTDAIRQAFINAYDMTPAEALVKLAQGYTVAGKNWDKGVYGIGKTSTTFSQNSEITVDPKTGHILNNGVDTYDPNDEYGCVYGTTKKGKTVACQYFYTAPDGTSYMSERNGIGRYYASTYADPQGNQQNASGATVDASDNGTVWEGVILSLSQFISWLISLFGGNTEKETLNNKNTLPNQQVDGFTYQSGFGEAGMIALALVAGGALLMGAPGKKGKKK